MPANPTTQAVLELNAVDNTTAVIKKVTTAVEGLKDGYGKLQAVLATVGVGLSAGYFAGVIKGAIDAMDHLNDLSKATGLAVDTLAGLKLAAKQSGSDLDGIAASINKLAVNMGNNAEKFAKIGVTAKDPLKAMQQLADIFVAVKDPQLRAALAAEALGKSWASAAPLLAEGGAKIGEMVERGKQLSGVTKESADEADKFNDALAELKATSDGMVAKLVGPMLSGFNDVLKSIQLAYEESGKLKAVWVALGALGQFLFTDDFLSKSVKVGRQINEINGELEVLRQRRAELAKSSGPLTNFLPELDMKIRERQAQIKLLQASLPKAPAEAKPDPAAEAKAKAEADAAAAKARDFLQVNKEMDAAYKSVAKSVADLTAVQQAELQGQVPLTEAQKLATKIMVELRDGRLQLSDALKKELAGNLELLLSVDQEIIKRKQLIEVYKIEADAAKALTDEEDRRNAVVAGANTTYSQAIKDIAFETEMIKKEAAANGAGLLLKSDEIRLLAKVNLEREIATEQRRIDLELERQLLALGPETNAGYEEAAEKLRELAQAQKDALPDALGARNNARLLNDLNRNSVDQFNGLWSTVESTGKQAFVHLLSEGRSSFKSIGDAIKASVIDLLYQLTVRKWVINIGTSIAGSLGISTAASAAEGMGGIGGIGNLFSAGNSLFGGGGTGGALSSIFGSPSVPIVDALGMGLEGSIAGEGILGALGGAGAGIGAALPWVGGALAIGGALGLFGGGGGPKQQNLYWNGGNFGADNITSQNAAFYDKVNAYTGQIRADYTPEQLQRLNGINVSAAAGTDENQLFAQLQQAVASAMQGIKSISQTKAETDAFNASVDQMRQGLLAARDPLGYWTKQVASLNASLGTSLSSVEDWRTQFLAVLDASPTQDQFAAWQQLGAAIQQATDAAAKGTGAIGTLTASAFSTLADFTRYQRTGVALDGRGNSIPHFASGGFHSGGARLVGENGPEIEITGPSRIISNADAGRFFDVSALLEEIKGLRADMIAGDIALSQNTGLVAKLARRWDRDGLGVRGVDPTLPLEVNVVQSVPVPVA